MAPEDKEARPTRTLRLELTVEVPDGLTERWQNEDSALESRIREIATHRPVENRITMLDAFETVGVTLTDVSRVKVSRSFPESEDIFDLGQRWYEAEIRAIARSILSDLADEKIVDEDRASEWLTERVSTTCDGHNWIIYTAKARLVNAFTSSPDAYADNYGEVPATDEARACESMIADVTAALRHVADEYKLDSDTFLPLDVVSDDESDDDA